MAYTIAFFGSKPYDEASFNEKNKEYGFELRYYKGHLNKHNVILTQGVDAVCIFVNDTAIRGSYPSDGRQRREIIGVALRRLQQCRFKGSCRLWHYRSACPCLLPLCRSRIYRCPHVIPQPENSTCYLADTRRKLLAARTSGLRHVRKNCRHHRHGKNSQETYMYPAWIRHEYSCLRPYPDYNFAREHQVVYTRLDELYHSSDIISLHCPLTEQTKYLINDYSISKMKDGVMIINTGRGQLIHTNALIEGLKNKKIGSAGLDVYEEESEYFYEDQSSKIIDDDTLARLLSFNNVIVTSHQAFFTREALANISSTTLQNIKDFMNHKPLENEVKA